MKLCSKFELCWPNVGPCGLLGYRTSLAWFNRLDVGTKAEGFADKLGGLEGGGGSGRSKGGVSVPEITALASISRPLFSVFLVNSITV